MSPLTQGGLPPAFDGSLYVFPTRNIVNFIIDFTFLTASYFSKARYSLTVLKVPLNPISQSIFQ